MDFGFCFMIHLGMLSQSLQNLTLDLYFLLKYMIFEKSLTTIICLGKSSRNADSITCLVYLALLATSQPDLWECGLPILTLLLRSGKMYKTK